MSKPLPSYGKPPVVETVVGVQFTPIAGWTVAHFGLYWNAIRDSFPKFECRPAIESQVESFEPPSAPAGPRFRLTDAAASSRGLYLDSVDGQVLIQVQADRFLFNWRKGESEADYPRYTEYVQPEFEKHFLGFRDFLTSEGLEPPSVKQCDVTYLNHIPQGHGWDTDADWHEVFTFMKYDHFEFLPVPADGRFNLNFTLPEKKGRLRVSAHRAVRPHDGAQIVVLDLTARGKPSGNEVADIREFQSQCREWIVRGFTELTSERLHELWQRES
ncbi:MAG: TIGR04255 family protein [Parvibaculaceae bacterium]